MKISPGGQLPGLWQRKYKVQRVEPGQTWLQPLLLIKEASGRALWGASIPVISVTVRGTEEKHTQAVQGLGGRKDEEELHPGEENALRREVHGS